MDVVDNLFFLGLSLKILVIDLLLSGDNAIVIALACRSLPTQQKHRAMLIGIVAAVALRVYLTMIVSYVLDIPGLKLAGAVALLIIAIKLSAEEAEPRHARSSTGDRHAKHGQDILSAVAIIVIADLTMSLDNVVALAAAAEGSLVLLVLGLLMSIPLLMYGSMIVAAVLERYPGLILGGGALLGWIAGGVALSDTLLAQWVDSQAPALPYAVPPLIALFVILESRIVGREQRRHHGASAHHGPLVTEKTEG